MAMAITWDGEAGRANWEAIRVSPTLSSFMVYIHPPRAPALDVDIFTGLAVRDLGAGTGCNQCPQQGPWCSTVRAKGKRDYSWEFWFYLGHLLHVS